MKQVSVAYFFEANHYTLANASWLRGDFEGPVCQRKLELQCQYYITYKNIIYYLNFQLISARSRNEREIEENSSWHYGLSRRYVYVVIENNMDRCVETH